MLISKEGRIGEDEKSAQVMEAEGGCYSPRAASRHRAGVCRGQTTVQNCIGGRVNVLSDYEKT